MIKQTVAHNMLAHEKLVVSLRDSVHGSLWLRESEGVGERGSGLYLQRVVTAEDEGDGETPPHP